jgi:hypothetical protein
VVSPLGHPAQEKLNKGNWACNMFSKLQADPANLNPPVHALIGHYFYCHFIGLVWFPLVDIASGVSSVSPWLCPKALEQAPVCSKCGNSLLKSHCSCFSKNKTNLLNLLHNISLCFFMKASHYEQLAVSTLMCHHHEQLRSTTRFHCIPVHSSGTEPAGKNYLMQS